MAQFEPRWSVRPGDRRQPTHPAGVCSPEGPPLLGWTTRWPLWGGSGAFPLARSSGSRALGPAELSMGREAGDPNGWPHVASSPNCSVIPECFPHSLSQATGPRQKREHGHVGGAVAVAVLARPQAPVSCAPTSDGEEISIHRQVLGGTRGPRRPIAIRAWTLLPRSVWSPDLCGVACGQNRPLTSVPAVGMGSEFVLFDSAGFLLALSPSH